MLVHRIRGIAGNLGAEDINTAGRALESALYMDDQRLLPKLTEAFCSKYLEVIGGISTLTESDIVLKKEINHAKIKTLLTALLGLLDTDLGGAIDCLEELGPEIKGTLLHEDYIILEKKLNDFETQDAGEIIGKIIKKIQDI